MSNTRVKFIEAIARQRIVSASYNGHVLKLAPHLMFERHGDLFVSALNLSKKWRSAEDYRLGHYKLEGLHSAELVDQTFEPLTSFNGVAPREDDMFVLSV